MATDASDDGGSGLNHYNLYVDSDLSQQVDAETTSTSITELAPNTSYEFHLVAVDAAGNQSDSSDTLSVTTAMPTGPRINSTSSAPSIDGTRDDLWDDAETLSVGNSLMGLTTNDDIDATASTLYDADNIYVLVEITDDEKPGQDSDKLYQDDAIEVYLDAGKDASSAYGSDDYQYQFRRDGSEFAETKHDATADVEWATAETDVGYNVEIAFPHATTGTAPSHGGSLGFDVHVVDDDDGGDRDSKIAWNDTDAQAWSRPSVFGTLIYEDTSA